MRILHIADLHLGKTVHGVSMLENGDQPHWVNAFLEHAERLKPDAVVIAGDVYDRSAPSGEAVSLLSRMLTRLSELDSPVMLIAGNHDSAQRLAFAGPILAQKGLHISRPLFESPELTHVTLRDDHGRVTFWLMPYVFPSLIAETLQDDSLRDYDTAVRALLQRQPVDFSERNVLIAHQNVVAAGCTGERGGSETMVGGLGQIDVSCFDGFDYVALGHIHAAYPVGRETVRYAGSPMCYHFNETRQAKKGPVLVDLGAKGEDPAIEVLEIPPLHPMRELRGAHEELLLQETAQARQGEYLRLVLTDRRLSPEAVAPFEALCRERGSVLMERCSEYEPFRAAAAASSEAVEQKSMQALFCDFYAECTAGEPPEEADAALLAYAETLAQHADVHADPGAEEIEKLVEFLVKQEGSV